MNYVVLCKSDLYSLINKVNEYLDKGWRPQGGVCVTPDGVFQAMVKDYGK